MADEVILAKLSQLRALGEKFNQVTGELTQQIGALEEAGGQANVLERLKVNGQLLTPESGKDGSLTPLGSPCWNWGRFYENVVRSILIGTWNKQKDSSDPRALNYWWGMSSGVVDVLLDDSLPPGVRRLAEILRQDLIEGRLDPFAGTIRAQDGRIINDGGRVLSTDEILHMDWLCENVDGVIPGFDQLLDMARNMVRLQGIYRETIPAEKVTT